MEVCDTVHLIASRLINAQAFEMTDYQRYWYKQIKAMGLLGEMME